MDKKGELDFISAKQKVIRPIEVNHFAHLKNRLLTGDRYEKAIIFVDNAGVDFVCGMLPFARYLVTKGTKVVIAANTYPSVNDITVSLILFRH